MLTAAIQRATDWPGLESYAWQLNEAIGFYRMGRGQLQENIRLHEITLTACLREGDKLAEGNLRLGLGSSHTYQGSFPAAELELQSAHDIFRDEGALEFHAIAHLRLCTLEERRGDAASALVHSQIALEMFEKETGSRGVAIAQNNIGWCLSLLGHHESALPHCLQALAISPESPSAWLGTGP